MKRTMLIAKDIQLTVQIVYRSDKTPTSSTVNDQGKRTHGPEDEDGSGKGNSKHTRTYGPDLFTEVPAYGKVM